MQLEWCHYSYVNEIIEKGYNLEISFPLWDLKIDNLT